MPERIQACLCSRCDRFFKLAGEAECYDVSFPNDVSGWKEVRVREYIDKQAAGEILVDTGTRLRKCVCQECVELAIKNDLKYLQPRRGDVSSEQVADVWAKATKRSERYNGCRKCGRVFRFSKYDGPKDSQDPDICRSFAYQEASPAELEVIDKTVIDFAYDWCSGCIRSGSLSTTDFDPANVVEEEEATA